jgi:protein phosphatase inhibitor 2
VEHRKQFANKRGGHYRNEAEAMKRAAAMLAEEDDEGSNESGNEAPAVPPVPAIPCHINGA